MDPQWVSSQEFRDAPSDDLVVQKFAAEIKLEDERRIRYVISDGSVDRENDTIAPGGWDTASYRKNPVVLWAHSHRDLPVAKAVDLVQNGDQLEAVAEFATHDFAQTVFDLVKGGFMRAVSVGFRPLEWTINEERGGVDFKRQELLEFSVVPVPANPRALAAAEAAGIDIEPLREWAKGILAPEPLDVLPDAGEGDVHVERAAVDEDADELPPDGGKEIPSETLEVAPQVSVTRVLGDIRLEYSAPTVQELVELLKADEKIAPISADTDTDEEFYFELADEPAEFDIDEDELHAALAGAEELINTQAIRQHIDATLDYMRGVVR